VVTHIYRRLGGDLVEIELTAKNVYAAYEEATLEYSKVVNLYQAKSVLSDALGSTTGTFDHNGQIENGILSSSLGGAHANLIYTNFGFGYSRKIWDAVSNEAAVGGTQPISSASINTVDGQARYNMHAAIVSQSAEELSSSFACIDDQRFLIKKVFYKSPRAAWRFFGYFGGINAVGNMGTYGQYADDSTWEIIPTWQNKLQAAAYEDALWTRTSHYSYEIQGNDVTFFPYSYLPTKIWFQFTTVPNAFINGDGSVSGSFVDSGLGGVNNINTLPFGNIPYDNINAIGKQWIRDYTLAICMFMLGMVRGKYEVIPIPGDSVTLNHGELLSRGQEMKETLIEELKGILDDTTYDKLLESDVEKVENAKKAASNVPMLIFVG